MMARSTDEWDNEVIEALTDCQGNKTAAAKKLGIARGTFRRRLKAAQTALSTKEKPDLQFPQFPNANPTAKEILEWQCKKYNKLSAAHSARHWYDVKVNIDGPIGVTFFGDPHIDDNGCNTPMLMHHCEIHRNTPGLYGVNCGDTTNNWVGRLGRLFAEQDASQETARILANWLLSGSGVTWLAWILGNHDCVTADTELLTKRGWIMHDDIQPDDMALGINTENGRSEWQVIDAVIRKPADTIWKLKGNRYDLACTAKHRVLTHRRNGSYQFDHPKDLSKHFNLPVARPFGGGGAALQTDNEIRFAAWVLTDGSIDKRGNISIYQSKRGNLAHIKSLLDDLSLDHSIYIRMRAPGVIGNVQLKSALPSSQYLIHASSRRRANHIIAKKGVLPDWVYWLSDRQFRVFLDEYIRGDGSWYPAPRKGAIIYGEKPILDDLQAACVSHGVSANLSQDNRGAYRLNVCFKQDSQTHADGAKWVVEPYDGTVWCLKVPHGNFMVRRNGKAHFTGNCWNDGEAILRGMNGTRIAESKSLFPGMQMAAWQARFSLLFPNNRRCKIWMSHDFPGHSQWNSLHGAMKAAKMKDQAHIYACGHKHNAALVNEENAERDFTFWLLRAKGYKDIDHYGDVLGHVGQKSGHSITAIIDPSKPDSQMVHCFQDMELAADFLTFKRSKM